MQHLPAGAAIALEMTAERRNRQQNLQRSGILRHGPLPHFAQDLNLLRRDDLSPWSVRLVGDSRTHPKQLDRYRQADGHQIQQSVQRFELTTLERTTGLERFEE